MHLYLVSGNGSDGEVWEGELCFKDRDGDYEGLGDKTGEYVSEGRATHVIEACTAGELKQALKAIYEPKGK